MENAAKVNAILKKLNGGTTAGDWVAAPGFHTYLALNDNLDGSQGVNLNKGITVKLFINKKTGEVSSYLEAAVK